MSSTVEPTRYVGFDTITRQIQKRLVRRGFQFNLMVVGQSGLGKSTLVNTLFASKVARSHGRNSATEPIARTPEITTTTETIVENGVHLALTVIDTPGYGDQVNNDKCWEPLVKYVKDQHSLYLRKELTAQRDRHLQDTRVHCVLFFIEPTGHNLKHMDLVVLKKLCDIANVIPVIAKSDALTLEERDVFKHRLREEFHHHNLRLYPFDVEEQDDDERQFTEMIEDMLPFAIIASEETADVGGKQVYVRRNRYGLINIEDPAHCEFAHLKSFLISTHLQDLIDTTAYIHYESFRSRQLLALKENSHPRKSK